MNQFTDGSAVTPGKVIATFVDYSDAQRLVDHLADKKFPVQHVQIIGRGLHSVEQVIGRVTVLRAALSGLISGVLLGVLFGALLGIFIDNTDWWKPLLVGAAFGAVWGAVTGAIGHALTGGRRDFASLQTMKADRYEVHVTPEFADQATSIAAGLPQKLTGA